MFGLFAFIAGIFKLAFTLVFASVGIAILLVLFIPLLFLDLLFRIGFGLMRVAMVFMLLCIVAVWVL